MRQSGPRCRVAVGLIMVASLTMATACAHEAGEPPEEAARSAEQPLIRFQPTTITLTPDAELQEAFRATVRFQTPAPPLRLTVEGVETPGNAHVGVRIFFNLPSADQNTPIDDPHYVGSFTFFPAGEDQPPNDYALDLAPVVRRLDAAGEFSPEAPVELTLVATPLDTTESPPGEIEIRYQRVTLSASQ